MNLAWWLETGVWDFPDKAAVIEPDHSSTSYKDLDQLANRVGNALRDHFGIGPDDVVPTIAGETGFHVAILFGLFKIGAVFTSLNRTQTWEKFKQDCLVCHPKIDPPFSCEFCHDAGPHLKPANHTPAYVDLHSTGRANLNKPACVTCHDRRFTCLGCH